MKLAFFQGCNIPIRIEQYARSAEAVLNTFSIELEIIPEFTCCGYPIRNVDEKAYLLPSVRNIAIAEKKGLDIMVICNCCFASLQKAKSVMAKNPALLDEINALLAKEDLAYTGTAVIKHFLTVLHEDIGVEAIRKKRASMFTELKVSVIHGCHILRPREVTLFDDSFVPKITDALVTTTGAENLDWRGRLECCGAPLAGINDDVANRLLNDKINGAQEAGADFMIPICSYCHLQFDTAQRNLQEAEEKVMPVLLYPQLLGLCLGLDRGTLGIAENNTITSDDIIRLESLLGPPVEEKKKKRKKKAAA